MKVFLNGRLLDARQAHVPVLDHGFLYGDGVYETVRAYEHRVFRWAEHDRRLRASARSIGLACPWSSRYLLKNIQAVLKANRSPNGAVRVTVSRGPGALGLDPALCPHPTLVMLLHPDRPMERLRAEGVSIGIPRVRRNHPRCLDPQIKSNNALNTILAKIEAARLGVFEAVLRNLDGHLTEGTISNLFFVKRGLLSTPALSCGLLEGVTRALVLRLARRAGVPVSEGRYTPADLRRADEIFLTSTTLEIVPVTRVVLRPTGPRRPVLWRGRPGPVTRDLQAGYQEAVRRELGL